MAGDVAPQVLLGSVYFEEATGDDSQPDVIQVSFEGGAAGTTLNRLVIDGDKLSDGLSTGDIFFDIEEGGLGAFGDVGFSIVSNDGFSVTSVAVVDGGTQIVFTFSGFDAGEVFRFSLDADEAQFVGGGVIDTNALVEGGEFQRSKLTGTFSAPHYVDLTLNGTYWDAFDGNFAVAQTATSLTLNLPNDRFVPNHDFSDRTAGAVVHAPQLKLATIAGWVYHDRDDDGNFDTPNEQGIGGVTLELLKDGVGTGITTTTSTAPGQVGHYEFIDLVPGSYGVREVQPTGWLDGKDTAGSHGGNVTNDLITGAVLNFGDDGVNYNFGELRPSSIRGRVHAHSGPECDFDNPEILLEGVVIELRDANGSVIDTTTTDVNGAYRFDNLAPGRYSIHEVQPEGFFDGDQRVGTAGGRDDGIDSILNIVLLSGTDGVNYDFCEHVGVMLSGNVYHDRSNDGVFDRATEEGIAGVVIQLLDENGNDTGLRATTDATGFYKFNNLAAGKYAVVEVHPSGWLDGIDTPGNLGGIAASSPGDAISMVMINWGENGTEYNFGELLPGSIAGRVHAHTGPECDFDNPEILLEGVVIELRDANGSVIDTTTTDVNGAYRFDNLAPGRYSIHEVQPEGFFDGDQRVGTAGGRDDGIDSILNIVLLSGTDGVNYDFCEHVGVMLSGNVYHDRSNDGVFDRATEEGIAGVVIQLLDENGNDTGLRATTDATGFYKFNNLAAGKYAVVEVHPSGWLDGIDTPGNLGGIAASSPGDAISMVMINWGENGTEYNFGELLPGSIRGRVVVSTDHDCDPNADEPPIAGVQIDLLDDNGDVLETTFTDANGEYTFTGLRPGEYAVREHQPDGFFDGAAHVGDGGGTVLTDNLLGEIFIGSDIHLRDYHFCETPPAEISGFVFIDGAPIATNEALTPQQIFAQRDGFRTPDDMPLARVVLELRDGTDGTPITGDLALAGTYGDGPIRTTTDANGFYQFIGLRAGTYTVVQVQPAGLIDGRDMPGLLGGFAVNPNGIPVTRQVDPTLEIIPSNVSLIIDQFRIDFGTDAIVRIPLGAGQHAQENNFSEVRIQPVVIAPPIEDPPPPESPQAFADPNFSILPALYLRNPLPTRVPEWIGGSSKALGYTWHLSVVNAGQPRSVRELTSLYHLTSAPITAAAWTDLPLNAGHWTLGRFEGGNVSILREEMFGHPEGKPVTGDFNGDGVWEVGVFHEGRWYLDLNGNGVWDEHDLWAKLGTAADLPVTGDWDDDGKTDIGIYGPAWERDPWAIEHEPGMPDADNYPTKPFAKAKNMPPVPDESTSGGRVLKRTSQGRPRADLIDHVFLYGAPGDEPLAGDWNGDGIRAIGVFRDGEWTLDLDGDGRFTENDGKYSFGQAGDLPIIGDFNGDGIDEVGVFRDGQWIIDTNGNRQIDAHDTVFALGEAGDVPVVGDWDGDGTDDPGTYRPGVVEDRVSRRAG